MYRLRLRDRRNTWRTGRIIYTTYLDAQIRQEELRLKGIKAVIQEA